MTGDALHFHLACFIGSQFSWEDNILFFTSTKFKRLKKKITMCPPCTPLWSHIISYPFPVVLVCFCLVVVWYLASGSHLRSFFLLLLSWHGIHPTCSAPAASPPQFSSHLRRQLMVGCCVPPSNGSHLRLMHLPPLSFLSINSSHQMIGSSPHHLFWHGLASSLMHSLSSKLNIGWLLYPPLIGGH